MWVVLLLMVVARHQIRMTRYVALLHFGPEVAEFKIMTDPVGLVLRSCHTGNNFSAYTQMKCLPSTPKDINV